MPICPVCEKPVCLLNDFKIMHPQCVKEVMVTPTIYDFTPIKNKKQNKNKQNKNIQKVVIEKEYIPMINVSHDPNDTTVYI
jgi:hypothetical protein